MVVLVNKKYAIVDQAKLDFQLNNNDIVAL